MVDLPDKSRMQKTGVMLCIQAIPVSPCLDHSLQGEARRRIREQSVQRRMIDAVYLTHDRGPSPPEARRSSPR